MAPTGDADCFASTYARDKDQRVALKTLQMPKFHQRLIGVGAERIQKVSEFTAGFCSLLAISLKGGIALIVSE